MDRLFWPSSCLALIAASAINLFNLHAMQTKSTSDRRTESQAYRELAASQAEMSSVIGKRLIWPESLAALDGSPQVRSPRVVAILNSFKCGKSQDAIAKFVQDMERRDGPEGLATVIYSTEPYTAQSVRRSFHLRSAVLHDVGHEMAIANGIPVEPAILALSPGGVIIAAFTTFGRGLDLWPTSAKSFAALLERPAVY